jgi:hypothetical protein
VRATITLSTSGRSASGNLAASIGPRALFLEQAIVALESWRTSFFFLMTPNDAEPAEAGPPRAALLIHRVDARFSAVVDSHILQAESAGRAALTRELHELLIEHPPSRSPGLNPQVALRRPLLLLLRAKR